MATYNLFLVLERFRRRFSQLVVALEPLEEIAIAPLRACTYFREDTGIVLLELSFDSAHFTAEHLAQLIAVADAARVPVIDPTRLSRFDRKRFSNEYLPAYPVTIADQEPESALVDMARRLRLIASPSMPRAQGKRANTHGRPSSRAEEASPQVRMSRLGSDSEPHSASPIVVEVEAELPPEEADTPVEPLRAAVLSPQAIPTPRAPTDTGSITVRGTPLTGVPIIEGTIEVKYRRGDEWAVGRLRALNSKGAYVAAGAPPRLRDIVEISLRYHDTVALVRGMVTRVTTAEDAAESGSAGFRIHFGALSQDTKKTLVKVLRKAHAAGVSLKPPPARRAVRFPVRWPIRVTTPDGHVTVSALDMSVDGLFLGMAGRLLDEELLFLLPLDNGEAPIRGRAQVCRRVDPKMARRRGLSSGYGVQITNLSDDDLHRYRSFLRRVRRRAERRLVVAATPDRARELATSLAAAGYAVTSGSDPGELLAKWEAGSRLPDAAIIDTSLRKSTEADQLLRSWEGQSVPCVCTGDEPAEHARVAVDRLLRVSAA